MKELSDNPTALVSNRSNKQSITLSPKTDCNKKRYVQILKSKQTAKHQDDTLKQATKKLFLNKKSLNPSDKINKWQMSFIMCRVRKKLFGCSSKITKSVLDYSMNIWQKNVAGVVRSLTLAQSLEKNGNYLIACDCHFSVFIYLAIISMTRKHLF